jgi:hypothetical protein
VMLRGGDPISAAQNWSTMVRFRDVLMLQAEQDVLCFLRRKSISAVLRSLSHTTCWWIPTSACQNECSSVKTKSTSACVALAVFENAHLKSGSKRAGQI